jgi:flavin reductase (DIM6/NTAB) family NADH-FMN oxidoreductase RutF
MHALQPGRHLILLIAARVRSGRVRAPRHAAALRVLECRVAAARLAEGSLLLPSAR